MTILCGYSILRIFGFLNGVSEYSCPLPNARDAPGWRILSCNIKIECAVYFGFETIISYEECSFCHRGNAVSSVWRIFILPYARTSFLHMEEWFPPISSYYLRYWVVLFHMNNHARQSHDKDKVQRLQIYHRHQHHLAKVRRIPSAIPDIPKTIVFGNSEIPNFQKLCFRIAGNTQVIDAWYWPEL